MGDGRRIAVLGLSGVALLLAAASAVFANGRVVYTLDDAYIHLALAERIAQGTYGINVGEFATPSSSILWPFLLALVPSGVPREAAPLVIGAGSAIVSVRVLLDLLDRTRLAEVVGSRAFGVWTFAAITMANVVGVVFTGMEHALHIALSLLVLRGVVRLDDGEAPDAAFWFGVVVGPCVRFEGLAVSGVGVGLAAFSGHRRGAGIAALLVACSVGGFLAWLRGHGQSWPSSVLVKLDEVGSGPLFRYTLPESWGTATLLVGCVSLTIWSAIRGGTAGPRTAVATVLVGLAHLTAGRYGWFGRYEVYAVCVVGAGALISASGWLAGVARDRGAWRVWALLVSALLCLHWLTYCTVRVPLAVRSLASQHVLMHVFAQHFDGSVASNDLGWVAYRAPHRVLDLWGLGSERARTLRMTHGQTATYLEKATEGEDVGVAMIYARWFPEVPLAWEHLGTLTSAWPTVGAGEPDVSFYLIDGSKRVSAESALDAMIAEFPGTTTFERAR